MQLKETFQRWCFLLSSWTFAPVFATSRNHFYFLFFPTCCWCEMMFSGRKQNCHFHSGLHYISALPVNLVRSLIKGSRSRTRLSDRVFTAHPAAQHLLAHHLFVVVGVIVWGQSSVLFSRRFAALFFFIQTCLNPHVMLQMFSWKQNLQSI